MTGGVTAERDFFTMRVTDFDLTLTVKSGQLFTYDELGDRHFRIIDGEKTFEIRQELDTLHFSGTDEQHIRFLFDLDRKHDFSEFPELLPLQEKYKGLRLVRQHPRQAILTFILSSNNNQQRIKQMVDFLRAKHPTALHTTDKLTLKEGKFGYREQFILRANDLLTDEFINSLTDLSYTDLRETLQTLPGVGPKVADCIMTYSTLRKDNAFPADVWVKRALQHWYRFNKPFTDKNIQEFARRFGNNAAYAQQYFFLEAQRIIPRKNRRTHGRNAASAAHKRQSAQQKS